MTLPTLQEAEALLDEAHAINPGPWAAHSRYVASAARQIAACLPNLDAERAAVLGLLHDIGRRYGVTGMRHVLDGYHFLENLGHPDAARVCLTHSYPIKTAASGSDKWDGTLEEYNFVQAFLDGTEYDPYDRLIQLCDSLALPTGFCLLEKRLIDVVMRYGFNELTLKKWRAYFAIKAEFDQAIGKPVYSVLPGIVENTFEMRIAS